MTAPLLTNGQALAILQNLYQLADEWSAEVSDIHAPASRYDKGATATWSVAAEQLRARLDRLVIADLSPRLCELEREALRRSGVSV